MDRNNPFRIRTQLASHESSSPNMTHRPSSYMELGRMKPTRCGTPTTCLAGNLGGEPGHDVQRRLDELHRRLQHQRHAEAARADARDGQPARITAKPCCRRWEFARKQRQNRGKVRYLPDDPDDGADDGDEDGEQRERQPQQPAQRPALAAVVAAAAHHGVALSSFPLFLCLLD